MVNIVQRLFTKRLNAVFTRVNIHTVTVAKINLLVTTHTHTKEKGNKETERKKVK